MNTLIVIIAAGSGCLGFSLMYNTKKNRLFPALFSAMAVTGIYLALLHFSSNLLLISMVCSIAATGFSETMARWQKAPASIFLIPGIIPLVPGGYLYYTMYGIVTNDASLLKTNANATVQTSLGIAIGIVIVSVLVNGFESFRKKKTRSDNY